MFIFAFLSLKRLRKISRKNILITFKRLNIIVCKFKKTLIGVYFEGNITKGWKFNGKKAIVESLPHSHQVDITWPRPESDLISTNKDLIVYVLLSRDKSIRGHTDWQEITQVSTYTL